MWTTHDGRFVFRSHLSGQKEKKCAYHCLHGAACERVVEISTMLDIDLNSEVVRLRSATSLETEGRMSEAYKICDE